MSRTRTLTHPRSLAAGGAAALAAALILGAAPAHAETEVPEPDYFTSAFTTMATPDQVVNNDGEVTPGTAGASGQFTFRVNSDLDIICYDITVSGISGEYESPAKTATHIHQADIGKPGPPRLAFPNPGPIADGERTSSGCIQGPFTTGLAPEGTDTGDGFTLAQLEANPAGFSADTHTVANPAGAVRGQLMQVPVGGVETGAGGTATSSTDAVLPIAAGGFAAALAALGFVLYRRRRAAE